MTLIKRRQSTSRAEQAHGGGGRLAAASTKGGGGARLCGGRGAVLGLGSLTTTETQIARRGRLAGSRFVCGRPSGVSVDRAAGRAAESGVWRGPSARAVEL